MNFTFSILIMGLLGKTILSIPNTESYNSRKLLKKTQQISAFAGLAISQELNFTSKSAIQKALFAMTDLSVRLLDRSTQFGPLTPIAMEMVACLGFISEASSDLDYQVPSDFDAIIPASSFDTLDEWRKSKDQLADTIYRQASDAKQYLTCASEESVQMSLEQLNEPLCMFATVVGPEDADGICQMTKDIAKTFLQSLSEE